MANNKQRYINTKLWNDSYVSQLDPIQKLLFIYFLTNEHTNISGFYELPLKIIAVETGIDESMLKKIMPRLSSKIRYIDGYIVIKNFLKHQETSSVNVKTGILNCLREVNKELLGSVVNKGYFTLDTYYLDTLCIPYTEGSNYLDSNLDLDSYSNLDSNLDLDSTPNKVTVSKESFGELKGVKLTDKEYASLLERLGEKNLNILIFELDTYIASKGTKYKSHYATLLNWANRKFQDHQKKQTNNKYQISKV
jgi:hypothetical protein